MQNIPSKRRRLRWQLVLIGFLLIVAAARVASVKFIASPECAIRVLDDTGKPMVGLRVTQEWSTSEQSKGDSTSLTNDKGVARFPTVIDSVNVFRLLTRPFLAFVPLMCGFNSSLYSFSRFDVYWPTGYTVSYEGVPGWSKDGTAYQRGDGVYVQDTEEMRELNIKDHVEIGLISRPKEFNFTLSLQRVKPALTKPSEEPEFKISPRASE